MNYTRFVLFSFLLVFTSFLFADDDSPPQAASLAPDLRARCLKTLRTAIRSDDFWPGMHAAEALTFAGAQAEVLDALHDRLRTERDDQRQCGLARELIRAGDRSQLKVLFGILADLQSSGRVHASESLYKLGETGDSQLLQAAFEQTENRQLQLYAAAALAQAGHVEAMTFCRAQLRSHERPIRNAAAFVSVRLGDESDVEALSQTLDGEADPVSRAILANALATQGNERGLRELQQNLSSPDSTVRSLAAEGAGYVRCITCQAMLIRLLDDTALDVRVRAAQSLFMLSRPEKKR